MVKCKRCCESFEYVVKRLCHKCYEYNRRAKIIREAKKDDKKALALKIEYRKAYIKSKDKGFYNTLSRRVSSSLNAYKTRDINLTIDQKWFVDNIVDGICHYCGISDIDAKQLTGNFLHVDRKDPSLGYKIENCVPACKACNTAKLHIWSYEETLQIGALFKKLLENRKGLYDNSK
jgi:5-methylcytosine-specific restriction endonuclease McrA